MIRMDYKVLVAGEGVSIRVWLETFEAIHNDVKVTKVPDCDKALEIIKEGGIDLAILNLDTGKSRLEEIANLRKNHPNTAYILMSVNSNYGPKAEELGVFIPTPFHFPTFRTAVLSFYMRSQGQNK